MSIRCLEQHIMSDWQLRESILNLGTIISQSVRQELQTLILPLKTVRDVLHSGVLGCLSVIRVR